MPSKDSDQTCNIKWLQQNLSEDCTFFAKIFNFLKLFETFWDFLKLFQKISKNPKIFQKIFLNFLKIH
jgi:hypothetical protein